MNGRKFSLTDLPGICRAILTGRSEREISRKYGCSPSTVCEFRKRLKAGNITYETLFSLPLDALIKEMCPNAAEVRVTAKSAKVTYSRKKLDEAGGGPETRPDFAKLALKVKTEKSTLWNEWVNYRDVCGVPGHKPMSRSWFYSCLSDEIAKLRKGDVGDGVSMLRDHAYGDTLMVDWSGTELCYRSKRQLLIEEVKPPGLWQKELAAF